MGGVKLDVVYPRPGLCSISPPVSPSPWIVASPPSPSSVVLPRPSLVQGWRFESLQVVLCAASDRQRLCHGNGRQVTHLAGFTWAQRDVRVGGVIKWVSVAAVTAGIVVNGDGRLGDDVIRRWRAGGAAGLHGRHEDILSIRV